MPRAAPASLLRSARIDGQLVDVLVSAGELRAIGPCGRVTPPDPAATEVVELDGRTVLPGLWDHHVHFDQWALARQRLDVSGARSAAEVVALVAARLTEQAPEPGAALIGFGFRDGLWPDVPEESMLDPVSGAVPVVLVSGDLHCGWLNSAAARRYGRAEQRGGLIRESDWFPILERVRQVPAEVSARWVAQASSAAAARGVVGVVEFEAPFQLDAWRERIASGIDELRVHCSVWPDRLDEAIRRGLRTGDVLADTGGLLTMGPLKVITDGSLNTRTAYCHDPYPGMTGGPNPCGLLLVPPEDLVPLLRRATDNGLLAAIHAIGDRANTLVLDAFAATGARGGIEHAQLLRRADVPRFAELGLRASVQPEHAVDDRDVADRYWAGRTERAFAYRWLLEAGVPLALGSDAPVAPLDPWVALAAAVSRTTGERPSWHPEQQIPLAAALAASVHGSLVVGEPADLVIVADDPFTVDAAGLRRMEVAGTLVAGRWTHRAGI